jgi:hypothetical protein
MHVKSVYFVVCYPCLVVLWRCAPFFFVLVVFCFLFFLKTGAFFWRQLVFLTISAGFNYDKEYLAEDALYSGAAPSVSPDAAEGAVLLSFPGKQYAIIELESPVICLPDSLLIGSRLDTDIHVNTVIFYLFIYLFNSLIMPFVSLYCHHM